MRKNLGKIFLIISGNLRQGKVGYVPKKPSLRQALQNLPMHMSCQCTQFNYERLRIHFKHGLFFKKTIRESLSKFNGFLHEQVSNEKVAASYSLIFVAYIFFPFCSSLMENIHQNL